MNKMPFKVIFGIALGVVVALFCFAMLNFYPFLGDDLVVREIQSCTFIICMVIAICTCIIISQINKKDKR